MDFPYSQSLSFLDFRLEIRSNSSSLLSIILNQFMYARDVQVAQPRDSFRFFLESIDDDSPSGNDKQQMRYYYDPIADAMQLTYLNGAIAVCVNYRERNVYARVHCNALPHESALGNWILTIPVSELLKQHGLYFMHAACLERKGKSFLFAGKSGSGKTTVTLGLLMQGWRVVSDDEVFLQFDDEEIRAFGGPEKFKITAQTQAMFPQIFGGGASFSGKQIIDIQQFLPGRSSVSGVVQAIFFLQPDKDINIGCIKAARTYERLLRLAFLPGRPDTSRENLRFLSKMSREIPGYFLNFNTNFGELSKKLDFIT